MAVRHAVPPGRAKFLRARGPAGACPPSLTLGQLTFRLFGERLGLVHDIRVSAGGDDLLHGIGHSCGVTLNHFFRNRHRDLAGVILDRRVFEQCCGQRQRL